MRPNAVKQALAEGKTVLGTSYGQLRDPEIARLLKAGGFDYVYLDGEHGGFGIETIQDICRTASLCGLTVFTRVADMQYALVARALDCGSDGVIFPRVESPELLEEAVSWCKFPPVGIRGFGLTVMQSNYEPQTIPQMIAHRNENGPFKSRSELKSVPRLGPKAFEQAAGFLRIRDAAHPLDTCAVHPERYALVEKMAADLGVTVPDLIRDGLARSKIKLENYVTADVGLPTLTDIVAELAKPGRDPREKFEVFAFEASVHKPEDLKPGMKLPGIVTNVTAFGAFVDIGVHQDGLVHVSQLADSFVKEPAAVVKPGQKVSVTVTEVDLPRQRIALSMRSNPVIGPKTPNGPGAPRAAFGNGSPRPAVAPAAPRAAAPVNNDWFAAALNKKR